MFLSEGRSVRAWPSSNHLPPALLECKVTFVVAVAVATATTAAAAAAAAATTTTTTMMVA